MKQSWILPLLGAFFITLLTSMKTAGPQMGSSDLKMEITTLEDLRVQLTGQNETGKKLYISVLKLEPVLNFHTAETELFAEMVPADISVINRTLNLSKLESGTYRIDVKAGRQNISRVLEIRVKPVSNDTRVIALH